MALREFTDNEGRRWIAWDVIPSALRHSQSRTSGGYNPPAWLAFTCPSTGERRRLIPIPEEWNSRSDGELCELCARADVLARQHPSRD